MLVARLGLAFSLLLALGGPSLAQCSCLATDLSGEWAGTWLSQSSGHKGPLKATLRQASPMTYEATFRGRFFAVLPFRYQATLRVVGQEGDRVFLAGDSYLGRLFGTFEYSAWADAKTFEATYTSRSDNGRFSLRR